MSVRALLALLAVLAALAAGCAGLPDLTFVPDDAMAVDATTPPASRRRCLWRGSLRRRHQRSHRQRAHRQREARRRRLPVAARAGCTVLPERRPLHRAGLHGVQSVQLPHRANVLRASERRRAPERNHLLARAADVPDVRGTHGVRRTRRQHRRAPDSSIARRQDPAGRLTPYGGSRSGARVSAPSRRGSGARRSRAARRDRRSRPRRSCRGSNRQGTRTRCR